MTITSQGDEPCDPYVETNQTQFVLKDPRNTDRRGKASFLPGTEVDSHRGSPDAAAPEDGGRKAMNPPGQEHVLSVPATTGSG